MIRVSVLYPNQAGKKFDADYYRNSHMRLCNDRFKSFGLLRYEVDKGVAGGAPGAAAPFVGACHFYFNSIAEFQKGMAAHGQELIGDIPNYTDIQPTIQISEIVVG
jgi:uncharacterized protein (TIGR02118 family)